MGSHDLSDYDVCVVVYIESRALPNLIQMCITSRMSKKYNMNPTLAAYYLIAYDIIITFKD